MLQVGKVLHKAMTGGLQHDESNLSLTAYIVISLLEANTSYSVRTPSSATFTSSLFDLNMSALKAKDKIKETKLLGVKFSECFDFESHVNSILKIFKQRSYLMRKLRDQCLSAKQLNIVFDVIILSRILYVWRLCVV